MPRVNVRRDSDLVSFSDHLTQVPRRLVCGEVENVVARPANERPVTNIIISSGMRVASVTVTRRPARVLPAPQPRLFGWAATHWTRLLAFDMSCLHWAPCSGRPAA